MKKKFFRLFRFFPVLVFGISLSCAGTSLQYVYNQDKEYVALKNVKVKGAEGLNHPYAINAAQLEDLLNSVYYKQMMIIRYVWSRPKPVFTSRQRRLLAQALSTALAQAQKNEKVEFSLIMKEHKRKRTRGEVFVNEAGFNLVLQSLHEPDFTTAVDRYQYPESRWKFWLSSDQQDYKYLKREQKAPQKNWLIIKLHPGGGYEENSEDGVADPDRNTADGQ